MKSASPSRRRSSTEAPSGAVTATSTPSVSRRRPISATSSRWRKPSAVGPRRLQAGRAPRLAFPLRRCKPAREAIEGFRGAPVLLLPIGGEFERYDRDRQSERAGEAAGIVLKQFGGAGGGDDNRLGLESLVGLADRGLEQLRRVGAEVAGLEGRVGDGRAFAAALDHGEQKIGVGVALRGVQHEVDARHARHDADRADMGRAFICPEREVHA